MTPELIVSIAAGVIALLFGYFPILRTKFAALSSEVKSLVMIGLMVLVGFGAWGAGCLGWMETGVACESAAIPTLIKYILLAIVTSQGINRLAPEMADVKAAKVTRDLAGYAYSGEVLGRVEG